MLSRRELMTSCAVAGVAAAGGLSATAQAQQAPMGMSDEQLEALITAQQLTPKKVEQRFDFAFKAALNGEEWELSMSAVLSQDGESIWVMAWLDELPKSAADVPRTALLRLLAANDKMGGGKFFAYIANNRRFVLQRVIGSQGITPTDFRMVLQDLGATVVETYPQWAVANWKAAPQAPSSAGGNPVQTGATQSATGGSQFQAPVRR
jgi:hypothetical protein